jgi:hypothetical protein
MNRCSVFLCTCAGALLQFACSSSVELSSSWKDREIVIDGRDTEWKDATTFVRSASSDVGVRNDGDYLYFCLQTSERTVQFQIVRLGLTVWFDPSGGSEKSFGIRFPLGGIGRRVALPDQDDPRPLFEDDQLQARHDFELVRTGGEKTRLSPMDANGIFVRMGMREKTLVYELRVPMRRTREHPYAVGIDTSQTVGIGIETEELSSDHAAMRAGDGSSYGSRGGRGRGGSSQDESTTADHLAPMSIWGHIRLAQTLTK